MRTLDIAKLEAMRDLYEEIDSLKNAIECFIGEWDDLCDQFEAIENDFDLICEQIKNLDY